MANYKYSTQDYDPEHMVRAVGVSLPISFKHSIEICNYLRNKDLQRAKAILKSVIGEKEPIPFVRFNHNVGHRRGMGPGRYPVKACAEILSLLDSVEANAQFKGLSTGSLVISHICAQKASSPLHSGRQRGIKMKRTNVEVMVEESKIKEVPKIKTKTAIEEKKEVKAEVANEVKPNKTMKKEIEKKPGPKHEKKVKLE